MNNLSGEYSDFVDIPLNSPYREEEVRENESLEETNQLTDLFQQQTQLLAEGPKKTKFTQPIVLTPVEAVNEGEAIKQDLEAFKTSDKQSAIIFEIESRMRVLLESDFPGKEEYQALYEQEVLPLAAEAKQSITQNPAHFAAQAAASKGKAAHAGLQALKNLTEKKSVVQNSAVSLQEVFLIPEEGVVFKRSSDRAKEEEHLVNELFGLTSKQAVVGAFDIQNTSAVKFGLQVSEETRARGFTPESLSESPMLKEKITEKLSDLDRMVLLKQESTPRQEDRVKKSYEFFQYQEFQLQIPGEDPKTVSFRELQRLNLAHQLPHGAILIAPSGEFSTIHDLLIGDPSFSAALQYFPEIHGAAQTLYLCPKINNPEEKAAYEQCEKFRWSYTNAEGDKVETDFKTVHSLALQAQPLTGLEAITSPSGDFAPTVDQILIALNVKWKVVSPELMQIKGETVTPLTGVQAKPFISEMFLMGNLSGPVREAVLERLTPDAEFNAILTGEFQLLDLHDNNLGVAPEPNEAYEYFKNTKFTTPGLGDDEKNFKTLVSEYLEGKILPDTVIEFNEGDQLIQLPLQELPDLQNALDVRWQFVIFDTDMSLSESNALQIQTRRNQRYDNISFSIGGVERDFDSLWSDYVNGILHPETVIEFEEEGVKVRGSLRDLPDLEKAFQNPQREYQIPLRSVLLATAWKDRPLSDEVVQRLIDSDERDRRVEHWVKREDTPIYKRLSKTVKEHIQHQIAPRIAKYDLSSRREDYKETTVKSLQEEFVKELSQVNTTDLSTFWYEIEDDLSKVIVRQNDTWETIARRHQQNVEVLFALNPGGLQPGQKVRISYDLTTSSPEAAQRRASIAAQLFPRMTQRQQEALFERQHSRSEYLSSYQVLSQSTLEGGELIAQIKEFVQKPETPLNSRIKKQLLEMLDKEQKLFEDPSELLVVKRILCEWCRPTYFNMMKAMYPLLADAHELYQLYYHDEVEAGYAIGLATVPLNEVVGEDTWTAPEKAFENQLAEDLWERMTDVKKPAFFGHF